MVVYAFCRGNWISLYNTRANVGKCLEYPPLLMFTKYFACNVQQKTDCKATQDNKSAGEELRAKKVEINWNNCLLQWWICYKYYGYSIQNHFAGSTIASLNQSLHFRLMWKPEILDFFQIFVLQVRKLWRNSPFAGPNMNACIFLDP